MEIRHYLTDDGRDILSEWLDMPHNREARKAIDRAIARMENGNFGVHKMLRGGVSEVKIDKGPGYRLYYGMIGEILILLLCAGVKKTQVPDIKKACEYLAHWKRRNSMVKERQ